METVSDQRHLSKRYLYKAVRTPFVNVIALVTSMLVESELGIIPFVSGVLEFSNRSVV
jgi:hypothetical protein